MQVPPSHLAAADTGELLELLCAEGAADRRACEEYAVGFADVFGLSEPKAGQDGYTLVNGLDPDGLAMYALGVLWHPEEDMYSNVIKSLVEAAREKVSR